MDYYDDDDDNSDGGYDNDDGNGGYGDESGGYDDRYGAFDTAGALSVAAAQAAQLPPAPPTVDGYFWRGAPINERQKAYCRCVLHVGAKNDDACYATPGALGTGRCYNPYAVCTASVGTQSECSAYYAFTPQAVRGGIRTDEVNAYARMRGLTVGPTREATVAAIYDYLQSRGK